MTRKFVIIADDQQGTVLPGPLHECVTEAVGPTEYQVVTTDKFSQVPGATQCARTFDGNGNPLVFTYKDADGNVLATCTYTFVGGNPTNEVWT